MSLRQDLGPAPCFIAVQHRKLRRLEGNEARRRVRARERANLSTQAPPATAANRYLGAAKSGRRKEMRLSVIGMAKGSGLRSPTSRRHLHSSMRAFSADQGSGLSTSGTWHSDESPSPWPVSRHRSTRWNLSPP